MTSKEFKEKIENSPTILNRHMLLVDDDVLSIIKDLEVLDILKRKINIRKEFDTWRQKYISIFYGTLTDEEKDKIVGWLDDRK